MVISKTSTFLFFSLFSLANALAETRSLGEPFEAEAQKSMQVLLTRRDSLVDLRHIYKVQQKKMKNDPQLTVPLLKECEVFPTNCSEGNILLFRGQIIVSRPGVSGLVRSLWKGTSYAQSRTMLEIISQLQKDVGPLKSILSAPTAESSDPIDRMVLSQNETGEKRWYGEVDEKESHTRFLFPMKDERSAGHLAFLNFRQILFTFHVNAAYFYYDDPIQGQEMLLDPLISFSSDLNQAMVFAVGNPQPSEPHHQGQLIVISVPRESITNLCNKSSPKMGEVWQTRQCSEMLNNHDDENEYDVFGYIKPAQIRGSFFVKYEDVRNEM